MGRPRSEPRAIGQDGILQRRRSFDTFDVPMSSAGSAGSGTSGTRGFSDATSSAASTLMMHGAKSGDDKPKASGNASAKKATRKGTPRKKAPDTDFPHRIAADRAKAVREVSASEKLLAQMKVICDHLVTDSKVAMVKESEVESCIARATKKLGDDLRWIFLGEDLGPEADEEKQARLELVTAMKQCTKELTQKLPVLKCSNAVLTKDPKNFAVSLYRSQLDKLLDDK